jgi:alcohol dehydrogenase
MRELHVVSPGKLDWQEVEAPTLSAEGDALVAPVAVTLCDLDRPMVHGTFPVPLPLPLGHEVVAEVQEVGTAVQSVRPGDLVVVPFQISCGTCESCTRGLTANCDVVPVRSQYGFGAFGGPWGCAFSDLMRVPFADEMLVPVPAGVEARTVAAAGDNLADGYRSVAPYLQQRPGGDVLVLGGIGSVPLYAAMFAVALGAGRVDYVDADPGRRAIAEQVGAKTGSAVPGDRRYDIAVDGTLLDPDGLTTAGRALRPDGTIVGATMYLEPPTIPYLDLYLTGAHFHTGRVHARANAPAVLDLVASGAVHPEVVTGGELVSFDDAADLDDRGVKPVFVR